MADDKYPQRRAKTEQHEPIFALGMIGISDQERMLIRKDGRSILKRDAVLPAIRGVLSLIPFKP